MSSPEVTDGVLFQDFTALAINVKAAPKNAVAMPKRNTRNSLMIIHKIISLIYLYVLQNS